MYEEGSDDSADEDARRLPRMREGDAPAKKKVDAEQHFTQPPPRFSEASLVKRMEELGIGRPSTYASIIKTLKDRAYVRIEKNRFFAEESGRLVTAFLERFFEKYVGYDYTAELEEELDDVSGGRAQWQSVLDAFWRDFKPRTNEVMEQQPSAITAELDTFLAPYLFPAKADGGDPRLCPNCGEGQLALRGGKFGAFIACSNYPECKYTRRFAQPGGDAEADAGPSTLGTHPDTGQPIERKSGRFGPYLQIGEGEDRKMASIPKDIGELNLEWAVKLLSLPRTVGNHPETGEPIISTIGKFGPHLKHAGKYARLTTTADVFETGMNAAVVKLAEAAAGGGRTARGAQAPLKVLGNHPRTEAEIKLMEGALRRLRHRRYDQRDAAQVDREGPADARGSGVADRRTRRRGASDEEEESARQEASGEKAPAKTAVAKDEAEAKAPAKKAAAKKAPAKKAAPKKKAEA
uniref:DNA topoisomerase n=1 Tax=Sphingomonas sp. H160509 TaxID=2955313 RepID=UPI003158CB49